MRTQTPAHWDDRRLTPHRREDEKQSLSELASGVGRADRRAPSRIGHLRRSSADDPPAGRRIREPLVILLRWTRADSLLVRHASNHADSPSLTSAFVPDSPLDWLELWRRRGGVSLSRSRCRVASLWRIGRCNPSVRTRLSGRRRIEGFDRRPDEDVMESAGLLDRAGRRRSQATLSGFHQGRAPRNKGLRYPPDPPPVEEIIAVIRAAGDGPEAMRVRGFIIVLWRAGLRISEALALLRPILTASAAPCSSVLERVVAGGRSGWTAVGAARSLARAAPDPAGRRALLRPARPDPRAACSPAASEPSCIGPPRWPESGAVSHPTNSGTPTLSRCPARGSRSWSYSANSGMPI